ncbi:hypothetical protein GCM10027571_29870 [Polaromonas eurypsychrophila]
MHLLTEQGIGALQFLVAQQEPLDAFGNLVDVDLVRHGPLIVGFAAFWGVESRLLVLAVWFTRRSSTGSRRELLPCARGFDPDRKRRDF